MNRFDKPVAAGDYLKVTIEKLGHEGDGMAFVDGFAVFVPDVEVGDEVEIEVQEVQSRCAFAEVLG